MPGDFRTLGRMARGLPPALQMTQEFSEGHGIEDAVRGHAAFTGHFDAQRIWSSSLMECASGLMLKMQP